MLAVSSLEGNAIGKGATRSHREVAMMTTVDDEGNHVSRSRPMVMETPFEDGALWFFTGRSSRSR